MFSMDDCMLYGNSIYVNIVILSRGVRGKLYLEPLHAPTDVLQIP